METSKAPVKEEFIELLFETYSSICNDLITHPEWGTGTAVEQGDNNPKHKLEHKSMD